VPNESIDATPKERVVLKTPILVGATLILTVVSLLLGGIGANGPAEAILMACRGLFTVTGFIAAGRALAGALTLARSIRTSEQEAIVAMAVDVLGNSMVAWMVAGVVLSSLLQR
jgi:hypothetical protein